MASDTTHVGRTERIGSAIAGAALLLRAVARPSLPRLVMAVGGWALLQRGLTGHWPLYRRLDRSAASREGGREPVAPRRDRVLEASEDSFPASDPPSWTPVVGALIER